jgi:hypothetical protein
MHTFKCLKSIIWINDDGFRNASDRDLYPKPSLDDAKAAMSFVHLSH